MANLFAFSFAALFTNFYSLDHARLKDHVAGMEGGLEAKINEGGKFLDLFPPFTCHLIAFLGLPMIVCHRLFTHIAWAMSMYPPHSLMREQMSRGFALDLCHYVVLVSNYISLSLHLTHIRQMFCHIARLLRPNARCILILRRTEAD